MSAARVVVAGLALALAACHGGGDGLGRAVNAERRGEPARALALYAAALDSGGLSAHDEAVAHANRCAILGERGEAHAALVECERAVAADPSSALALTNRGAARNALGDHAHALADHDAALALDPGFAVAYNNRCESRLRLGDAQAALADCERAVALAPDLALAHLTRAEVLAALGRLDSARTALAEAEALAPGHPIIAAKASALGLGRR